MTTDFAHLHVHSEFSILDGLGTVEDYVARAKALGQSSVALTDHGVLCGMPSFYHAARKEGIEPILGEEFYFVPDAQYRPVRGSGEKAERFHVVLLARGRRGYQVLSELSTESHKNFYYKPLIDRAALESLGDDAKHLVCLSGCAGSIISRLVIDEGIEAAEQEMYWWRETFPHFYIELQNHETDFDRRLNEGLLQVARRHDIPWVITNDPHYVVPEDDCHHDALLAIQTASDLDDPNRFKFDGSGYHLRSRREMYKAFVEYGNDVWKPGAAATLDIAAECKVRIPEWEKRSWHIPAFPDSEDAQGDLERIAWEGLRRIGKDRSARYKRRLRHELEVMGDVGIADFMLITRWIIREAIERGIPVGPGRGSVCGTLVGYVIGLHKVDPIKYDLRFERFLNPARPRMPDIDTDFGQIRRTEVFDFIAEKFGAENVVGVAAYGRMKNKKAFGSLSKAYGISFQERMRISKAMPDKPEDGEDLLPKEITDQYPQLADQLDRLSGVRSELKGHPAGVIIASPEYHIRRLVPEMWLASAKKMCGQYDLDAVEEMGLMKEDCLGLRTLDTIALAVELIKDRHGIVLDPDSWSPDEEKRDSDVYAMLANGGTSGVFQLEGNTNTRGIKAIEPHEFEDLVSCTALYRTGPIMAGYPKIFLANRKGSTDEIEYAHPLLTDILEKTWGVILYQEQVMDIGRVLAGFDNAGEDEIKEAIKHKKSRVMDELRPIFIRGCKEHNGIPRSVSTDIWKDIEGYAGYSYNRSHAVAYTLLTYQTARLRCLYPVEFFSALLATVDLPDKIEQYRRDCVGLGIKLRRPCINRSAARSQPEGDRTIRFGIEDIKGVGPAASKKVLSNRGDGFSSLDDVVDVVGNKGVVEALGETGALSCLGVEADIRKTEERLNWKWKDGMKRYRPKLKDSVDFPTEDGEWCIIAGEIIKAVKGKTKDGSKEYMTWTVQWGPNFSWTVRLWSETSRHWNLPLGSVVMVNGKWEAKWSNISVGKTTAVEVVHRAS